MNKKLRIAMPLMAAAMMTSVPFVALAQTSQGTQTQTTTADDYNSPPAGTEQAQAYRDGIEAAQLDKAAKRPIDPKKSFLYVHPPVKGAARDGYRSSFESGYQARLKHDATS